MTDKDDLDDQFLHDANPSRTIKIQHFRENMACKNHNDRNWQSTIIALILNRLTLLTQRYVHIVRLYQRKNVTDKTMQIKNC